MFLFRHISTRKVTLHVGDFRWDRATMLPAIRRALKPAPKPVLKTAKGGPLSAEALRRRPPLALLQGLAVHPALGADCADRAATGTQGRAAGGDEGGGEAAGDGGPNPPALDFLFLDTTYLDPSHCFPPQAEVIDAAAALVGKFVGEAEARASAAAAQRARSFFAPALAPVPRPGWGALRPPPPKDTRDAVGDAGLGRLLVVFGSYSIGKERLYLEVARRCGLKVRVDSGRLRTLKLCRLGAELEGLLTTERKATPLWVAPLGHVTFETLAQYAAQGQPASQSQAGEAASASSSSSSSGLAFDTVVGFRPTGWSHAASGHQLTSSTNPGSRGQASNRGGSETPWSPLSQRQRVVGSGPAKGARLVIVGAPYSEHSSFPELLDCTAALRAKRIVPTVNCHSEGAVKQQLRLLQPAVTPDDGACGGLWP